MGRAAVRWRGDDGDMLRATATAFCGLCGTTTTRFERHWRAYIVVSSDGKRSVMVVCPACSESACGEDEATWN